MDRALTKSKGTMLDPGSEFRKSDALDTLFRHHEQWPRMKEIISKGVTYPLEELPEHLRQEDLKFMIAKGNHKSSSHPDNHPTLLDNYEKEVKMGWMLPVTFESVMKIKGAGVIPVGVAQQFTIDNDGERIIKRRTTHDASFPPPSNKSINQRMLRDLLEPCYYGHCLLRILHSIHKMRFIHPTIRIFLIKLDLDAAYRRLHVVAEMAVLAITIIKKIAYILLRLPFGVANGPNDFSLVSEPIIDLTNDILHDDTFDPNKTHSPLNEKFQAPNDRYPTGTPFGRARRLFVDVPFHWATADGYIDDIITAMLEVGCWVQKGWNAAPLAVHATFRPTDINDPLPRDDATSIRKLVGEGTPDESKSVLGWQIDTRQFRIFLPSNKAFEWTKAIDDLLLLPKVPSIVLESTIGRLNHAGYIIPQARYFLNRTRHLLARCLRFGPQAITDEVKADLSLWKLFLDRASTIGVDINNITFTDPTETTYSDACEHGLGGYTNGGIAWRLKLPPDLIGRFSINLLEFIAAAITIHLHLNHAKSPQKILAYTDSSSALGWLYKASFPPEMKGHDQVARWLAMELINADSALYSQHIKGVQNAIADMLSRDHHLTNNQLTCIFNIIYPEQMSKNFEIVELPPTILLWLYSLEPSSIKTQAWPQQHYKSKLGALISGNDSCQALTSRMNGLLNLIQNNAPISCLSLQAVVVEMNLARQRKASSKDRPLKPPSQMYARPFGRIFGQTRP